MSPRLILSISLVIIIFNLNIAQAEYCQVTKVQSGLFCSTVLGDLAWQEKTMQNCGATASDDDTEKCCCNPNQSKAKKTIAPKYIIMGTAAAVLGAIAIISFALRKRELE